jgi:recombinational DNA repair ATPase RecF
MNDFDDLKDNLAFSKHDLDTAILQHSSLYFTVSEHYAHAASVRDECKQLMEESYAVNSLRIRDQAAEEGRKITEELVKQLTLLDPEYQQAQKEFLTAKKETELWAALKEAYSTRGYMIKEIAELWKANYFAASAITGSSDTDISYESARTLLAEKRKERKPLK